MRGGESNAAAACGLSAPDVLEHKRSLPTTTTAIHAGAGK